MFPRRLFALALLLVVSVDAPAQPVFVQGEEDGQGFLRQRGDDCYLITPQHVLQELRDADFVSDRAVRHRATLVRSYDPDLAILRVDSDLECSGRFPDGRALDRLLVGTTLAHLVFRSASGAIRQTGVEIVASDERFIRIRPANDSERLFRGMSGSPLMIGRTTAGMLQSVDADSGMGRVLRQDFLGSILSNWFFEQQPQRPAVLDGNFRLEPVTESNDVEGLIERPQPSAQRNRAVLPGYISPITKQHPENETETERKHEPPNTD